MYRDLSCKTVTTRKEHKCEWCGETIEIGGKAQYRCYIFDGFQAGYLHSECWDALEAFPYPEDLEEGFDEGMFERGSCIEK